MNCWLHSISRFLGVVLDLSGEMSEKNGGPMILSKRDSSYAPRNPVGEYSSPYGSIFTSLLLTSLPSMVSISRVNELPTVDEILWL
jgi:hypothetical protein